MKKFEMNEKIEAQLAYYVRKYKRLAREELPLEEVLARMFHREEDWWEQEEAIAGEPPHLPGLSGTAPMIIWRKLAATIIDRVERYTALMEQFTEDPEGTVQEWLEERLANIAGEVERELRTERIRRQTQQIADALLAACGGQAVHTPLTGKPGSGKTNALGRSLLLSASMLSSLSSVAALSATPTMLSATSALVAGCAGTKKQQVTVTPGECVACDVIQRYLQGSADSACAVPPFEEDAAQGVAYKAIGVAMMYLLCGDGCLPETYDVMRLEHMVPVVCMTHEMQALCGNEAEGQSMTDAACLLDAAWNAAIHQGAEQLLESDLRQEIVEEELNVAQAWGLAMQAACAVTPLLWAGLSEETREALDQMAENMLSFYNRLALRAAQQAGVAGKVSLAAEARIKNQTQQNIRGRA